MEDTFWVRMAARVRPTEALETIEQPMSLVRLSTGAVWGATVFAIIFAFVLLSFDEQAAAWTTLGLAIARTIVWMALRWTLRRRIELPTRWGIRP